MAVRPSSRWNNTLAAARSLILAQGEVVYAYNLLQDRFFRTFLIALSLERPDEFGAEIRFYDHALALWHVIQSDNQQRKLAITAVSTMPTTLKLKSTIKRLEWARTKADKLVEYRNMIAHNTIMFRGQQKGTQIIGVPTFGGDSTRAVHKRRLKQINGLRFWATLRNDFLNLSEYVEFLNRRVWFLDYERRGTQVVGAQRTLPGRPRLRSLRLIRLLEASQPKAVAARRQVRRKSSPAKSSP